MLTKENKMSGALCVLVILLKLLTRGIDTKETPLGQEGLGLLRTCENSSVDFQKVSQNTNVDFFHF